MNKISQLPALTDFPEVMINYFPMGDCGPDKYGCPVWICAYGRADLKGIFASVKKKDYVNYVKAIVEKSVRLMHENHANLKLSENIMMQQCVIFDMQDFSMKHITHKLAMETALQLIQMYEANYPELLRRVFVLNAPRVFTIAWNMIKPFLHERTRSKIQIFGWDSVAWKRAILEDVDPSRLPAFYGGSMTDPDGNPQWRTRICMGGLVPKSYYWESRIKNIGEWVQTIIVNSGAKQQLEYEVERSGQTLRWSFQTDQGDIAFAVYRKQGDEKIEVVPRDRIDSHIAVEEGEIISDNAGLCTTNYIASKNHETLVTNLIVFLYRHFRVRQQFQLLSLKNGPLLDRHRCTFIHLSSRNR